MNNNKNHTVITKKQKNVLQETNNDYALYYIEQQAKSKPITKKPVILKELIKEMAIPSQGSDTYYVVDKGIYINIPDDAFVAVDEGVDKEYAHLYRISKKEFEIAAAIENDDPNYICLPIDEIIDPDEMIHSFIELVDKDDIYDQLQQSCQKLDSFSCILDTLIDNKLLSTWFAFRDYNHKNIAFQWCEKHQLEYVE